MIKIATVTFHHAHNFGSALQTYALKTFTENICGEAGISVDYKVIDYYTKTQEELYSVYKHGLTSKNIVKNTVAFLHSHDLKIKHQKFETFLKEKCNLTKRYKTEEELKEDTPEADVYISGSDQIWNVRTTDFSSVYYLDFLKNTKKISYAASFGPLNIDWEKYDKDRVSELLRDYTALSVREEGSLDNVKNLTGRDADIHVDPTLLLSRDEWRKIQSNANYNDGKYILLYCLEPSKAQLECAERISEKLNLPIVVLRYNNKNDMFNKFVKRYDSGPEDFLAYIDNAALVLTSSFHGTAFSLIYSKPFYVFNGMNDNRISTILKNTDCCSRSINNDFDLSKIALDPPDRATLEKFISEERCKSADYLMRNING